MTGVRVLFLAGAFIGSLSLGACTSDESPTPPVSVIGSQPTVVRLADKPTSPPSSVMGSEQTALRLPDTNLSAAARQMIGKNPLWGSLEPDALEAFANGSYQGDLVRNGKKNSVMKYRLTAGRVNYHREYLEVSYGKPRTRDGDYWFKNVSIYSPRCIELRREGYTMFWCVSQTGDLEISSVGFQEHWKATLKRY